MLTSDSVRIRRRISLTPLIDVIFLLLMFFMLSSTFSKFADLDVARQSTAPDDAAVPPVTDLAALRGTIVSVSAHYRVRINGTETGLEEVAERLDALYDQGARTAIIVADFGATVQDLVSVLEQARRSRIAIAIAR